MLDLQAIPQTEAGYFKYPNNEEFTFQINLT